MKFGKRLTERKITLEFTAEAKSLLIEKGYDEKYGARPLRRAVEHFLEDPLPRLCAVTSRMATRWSSAVMAKN